MKTRTIVMTVYKIECRLIDVTVPADLPNSRFLPGHATVHAEGRGEFHSWNIDPVNVRCWIGDRVEVTVIDPEPVQAPSTTLTPPPIDKR